METLEFRHFDNQNGGGCRLYINGVINRKCTATGCGYDRQGAAFGNYVNLEFQEELKEAFAGEIEGANLSKENPWCSLPNFYGTKLVLENGEIKIIVDGSCGFNIVEKLLNYINYNISWTNSTTNSRFYTLEKTV